MISESLSSFRRFKEPPSPSPSFDDEPTVSASINRAVNSSTSLASSAHLASERASSVRSAACVSRSTAMSFFSLAVSHVAAPTSRRLAKSALLAATSASTEKPPTPPLGLLPSGSAAFEGFLSVDVLVPSRELTPVSALLRTAGGSGGASPIGRSDRSSGFRSIFASSAVAFASRLSRIASSSAFASVSSSLTNSAFSTLVFSRLDSSASSVVCKRSFIRVLASRSERSASSDFFFAASAPATASSVSLRISSLAASARLTRDSASRKSRCTAVFSAASCSCRA